MWDARLCAAAVSLPLRRIGRWSGREIDASQAERLGDRASLSRVPRSRSHARLRRNTTMSHAFSSHYNLLSVGKTNEVECTADSGAVACHHGLVTNRDAPASAPVHAIEEPRRVQALLLHAALEGVSPILSDDQAPNNVWSLYDLIGAGLSNRCFCRCLLLCTLLLFTEKLDINNEGQIIDYHKPDERLKVTPNRRVATRTRNECDIMSNAADIGANAKVLANVRQ
ncbi:hypothetical protein EVAR_102870_1 [Eumeta japonica]|uniref:Uncharacterized protein n=1 Tax=Eumeta variegata TaxID=151549 RepID=A0A4C1UNQ7_EUMVA|nr:hypothetical protein EVAR_102870_1 [Eumeta japonica]